MLIIQILGGKNIPGWTEKPNNTFKRHDGTPTEGRTAGENNP